MYAKRHRFLAMVATTSILLALSSCSGVGGGGGSSGKITSFVFRAADNPGLVADVTATITGTDITASVDSFFPLTDLVPTIAVSSGATLDPPSGTAYNFTHGMVYTVIDADGFTVPYSVSITNSTATLIAGDQQMGGTADGTGTAARFDTPQAMVTDGTYLYIADTNNSTIRKMVLSTRMVTTIAGLARTTGTPYVGSVTGANARFNHPSGVTLNGSVLYITDTNNNNIQELDTSTNNVTTSFVNPGFNLPEGVSTFGTVLYMSDAGDNRIVYCSLHNAVPSRLDLDTWSHPRGTATDGTWVYAADSGNNVIKKVRISAGVALVVAGQASPGSMDGTGIRAQFNNPHGVTVMGNKLFVTDYGNNAIRCIDLATNKVSTLVSSTTLLQPWAITGYGTGTLYVAAQNAIYRIQ